MARHGVRRRFANSTRRARHKRMSIYVPVYLVCLGFQSGLLNLTGLEALGADSDPLNRSVDLGTNFLDVG